MTRTCDWCGEQEPEAGSFDRTDEKLKSRRTVLCPNCSPDSDVRRGIYVVYSFTADVEDNNVGNSVENYVKSSRAVDNFRLIKDVGPDASTEGNARYALVIDVEDGLSHYSMRSLLQLPAVIDASNGDMSRNNCRALFYNYEVADVLSEAEEPRTIYKYEE